MKDVREDLGRLLSAVSQVPAPRGQARALLFVGLEPGEGTSSVSMSLSMMAARHSDKPVWHVSLEAQKNEVFKAWESSQSGFRGRLGRSYDASLRTEPFFRMVPEDPATPSSKLLTAHEIEGANVIITRFREEYATKGQHAEVTSDDRWWQALRGAAGWIIVDAPALSTSSDALAVCDQMDGVILVASADRRSAEPIRRAKQKISAHGGHVLGLAMNKIGNDVMRSVRR